MIEQVKVESKKVRLNLTGLDGNAYNLLDTFAREAKRQGWSKEEVERVLSDARSGDYDHLVSVLVANTDVVDDGLDG